RGTGATARRPGAEGWGGPMGLKARVARLAARGGRDAHRCGQLVVVCVPAEHDEHGRAPGVYLDHAGPVGAVVFDGREPSEGRLPEAGPHLCPHTLVIVMGPGHVPPPELPA